MDSQEAIRPLILESDTNFPNLDPMLSNGRLAIVMMSFTLLMSLSGLDQTVLSTSLVTITSRFNAVSDIAWVTSVFFIAQSCFMLLYGKALNIAPPKIIILFATGLFILGSFICGVAPTINALIAGRAVAGLGGAGVWIGILTIIPRISTLSRRPILIGLVASAYGLCSLVGPVLGGVLSERVSWRWCFYINLPIGGLGIILIVVFLPNLPTLTIHKKSAWDTWLKLDWIGTILNIAATSLFLVGLQLGGNIRPWNDPAVIVTLIIGVVLGCLFIQWEVRKGSEAILTTMMFKRRNIVGSFLVSSFLHWTFLICSPILYQLRGHSVIRSGIEVLPLVGSGILGGAMSGVSVTLTSQVWIWLFFPPLMGTIGFIFLSISTIDTSLASLAGYQILVGYSLGATIQNCIVVAQAEYADKEDLIPQATSIITFGGLLFSAIGTAVAGAMFSGVLQTQVQNLDLNLSDSLHKLVLENIDAVLGLPENLRTPLIGAYITAVNRTFIGGTVINSVAGVSALLVERKRLSIKPPPRTKKRDLKNPGSFNEIMDRYKAEPWRYSINL